MISNLEPYITAQTESCCGANLNPKYLVFDAFYASNQLLWIPGHNGERNGQFQFIPGHFVRR